MTRFNVHHGLRITGDVVTVGGPNAVAEIHVVVNGRTQTSMLANRISSYSYQNGGTFYGGFLYTLPMNAFKGGLSVVTLSDANSAVGISDFEFTSDDYVYEQMLLAQEYGDQIPTGGTIVPVAHTATLKSVLPNYIEQRAEPRSRIGVIVQPVIDWLLRLIDARAYDAAIELLTSLQLNDLVRADAIKTVQIFMLICVNGTKPQRKKLGAYLEKFPKLQGGDTYNMLALCLRCGDVRNPLTLDDVKAQLLRWRFSGRAMMVAFEFTELVFGKTGLAELKSWAMQEWLSSETAKEIA